MKALAISGPDAAPAVLDVPEPSPGPGEVRIALTAASVNGFDLTIASGRLWDSTAHEFPVVLGRDYVGVVDAVGAGVDHLQVGQTVAGVVTGPALGHGSLAEYVVNAVTAMTVVPAGVEINEAATIGLAGVAAADAADALDISPGQTLFVSGATGGVGSIVVQIAVGRGAEIAATARPGAEEAFVRELGASHAVDFTGDVVAAVRELFPAGVDRALHAAGDPAPVAACLRPGGRLASMVGATNEQVGRDDIDVVGVAAHATVAKLDRLLALVAAGDLRVGVTATFPLEQAAAALDAFRSGTLGKVLITR